MRINTNMAALNAWRSAETNQNNLQKSLARLSSGYRINTAADDAAGLAVSEKLTAQMRGISMATRNAQDASSLVQTAEGGAGNIQDMLQRMRELAVQASSDTLQDSDRSQLQQEFSALQSEIDRTAGSVNFNGRKLINGESGDLATVTAGNEISNVVVSGNLKAAARFTVSTTSQGAAQTQVAATAKDGANAAVSWNTTSVMNVLMGSDPDNSSGGAVESDAFASGDKITFTQYSAAAGQNVSFTVDLYAEKDKTVVQFVNDVNAAAADAGVAMRMRYVADGAAGTGTGLAIDSNVVGTAGDVNVTEVTAGSAAFNFADGGGGAAGAQVDSADATVVIKNTGNGATLTKDVDYTVSGNTVTGIDDKDLQGVSFYAEAPGSDATLELTQNTMTFQVGANSGDTITASLGNLTTTNLQIKTISISNKSNATTAIGKLDTALSSVSTERAKMGAMQNRLDNAVSSLQTQNENITAANSRIRDVDMAAEMANFTKYQVLSQASTAMLAQANQLSQGILTLLR